MTTHIPPKIALLIGGMLAENSINTSLHAMDVHVRRMFHAMVINTTHSVRVTGKGRFIVTTWVWKRQDA